MTRRSSPSRNSSRGLYLKPHIQRVGDMGLNLVPLCSFTPVLEGLLIFLLTYLNDAPLCAFNDPSDLCILILSMLGTAYGVP